VTRANIGLGANLGDPIATMQSALRRLEAHGRVVARSSLYRTPAWGVTDQPPFVNAALTLETALEPLPLLAVLKGLEAELGRVTTIRWGPRAIDLDILTFGDLRLDEAGLTIPHPSMRERAFVLVPLAEIDAAFAPLRDALPAADLVAIERIGPFEREGPVQ
jgi:2-amino-4-hydroxy-6-hydroxymethyldihydropteridine diphosphokinase